MRATVYRPVKGRLQLKIPFAPDNRASLRGIALGVRPDWDAGRKRWLVSRASFPVIVATLAQWYGGVHVVVDGRTAERCDLRCRQAIYFDCVCACAGKFHGMGSEEPGRLVNETTIVLGAHVRREWDEYP